MIEPVYDRWGVSVFHGDNLNVLREMPDASVDSIVTDPPAGIGFMRDWDSDRGGRDEWVAWLQVRMVEALRILKPGGHALVWAMPRTSHWTGLALEDASFEIRDLVQHVFDQGFPKSLDVSREIDRLNGRDFDMRCELARHIKERRLASGVTRAEVALRFPQYREVTANWERTDRNGNRVPTLSDWAVMAPWLDLSDTWTALIERVEAERADRIVVDGATSASLSGRVRSVQSAGSPVTEEARRWAGWGTALRPAGEPWWLCRKPLRGQVVAEAVQQYGTGAINIDATRGPDGQWPANVAKFPKAPPSERPMVDGEQHPTVKSVALCRWLVRLVTPPGGTVLDLFAGTGPVGQAARAESMKAVLIEQDAQSIGFIRARLDARAKTEAGTATDDGEPVDLLDLLGGDAS